MTTLDTTITANRTVPLPWPQRLANVVRLQFTNPWTALWTPLMILSFIFVLNVIIWVMIDRYSTDGMTREVGVDPVTGEVIFETNFNNGGMVFLIIYMLVVAVQTMNLTFSYAMSYGVTRRDYYLGTSVFFVGLSVFYSLVATVMSWIETSTNGWGYRAQFFAVEYTGVGNGVQTFAFYLMLFLLGTFVGAAVATVYVRWKASGMLIFWALVVLAIVAAIWLISELGAWQSVWHAGQRAGTLGVLSWTLVLTALAAIGGYLTLRRTTPRNA